VEQWYVIAWTPDGMHVYGLPAGLEDPSPALDRIRSDHGFPEVAPYEAPWDLSIAPGEPHHSIMENATFHDWSDGVPE
jgi:hypothetical protein